MLSGYLVLVKKRGRRALSYYGGLNELEAGTPGWATPGLFTGASEASTPGSGLANGPYLLVVRSTPIPPRLVEGLSIRLPTS
jgi:hypothetical protein